MTQSQHAQNAVTSTNDAPASDCPICAKQQGAAGTVVGGPIYADDLLYVHHAYMPDKPTFLGFVRLETRRHVPSFAELTPDEAQAIGLMEHRLSRALKECAGADHAYAFFYGDHVPHLHILIWARYPGTPREYWRERVDEWSGSPLGGAEEVAALSQRLRDYLNNQASLTKQVS